MLLIKINFGYLLHFEINVKNGIKVSYTINTESLCYVIREKKLLGNYVKKILLFITDYLFEILTLSWLWIVDFMAI